MRPAASAAGAYRRVLFNDKVGTRAIIVVHVGQQHMAQMAFAEYHDMIKAFPADRADQAFCGCVLPGWTRRRRAVSNADRSNAADKYLSVCTSRSGLGSEGFPAREDTPPHHIFGHAGLTVIDVWLEKLAMDPRYSPQRIGAAHLADTHLDASRFE
jgi:hypothetical protein